MKTSRWLLMVWMAALVLTGTASAQTGAKPCPDLEQEACVKKKRGELAEKGVTGLLLYPLREQRSPSQAHLMLKVVKGEAAEAAGVQDDDRLIGWEDRDLTKANSDELMGLLRGLRAGDEIELRLERGGKELSVPITAGRPGPEMLDELTARFILEAYGMTLYQDYLREIGKADRVPPAASSAKDGR